MAHTPGPWEIEPKEHPSHPRYVMDGQGDRIAKCDGLNISDFGPNPEQCKANARLIAAAPELLSAAVELVNAMRDREWGTPAHAEAERKALAAISKAEGTP